MKYTTDNSKLQSKDKNFLFKKEVLQTISNIKASKQENSKIKITDVAVSTIMVE